MGSQLDKNKTLSEIIKLEEKFPKVDVDPQNMGIQLDNKILDQIRKLGDNPLKVDVDPQVFQNLRKSLEEFQEKIKQVSEFLKLPLLNFNDRDPLFIQEDWYLSEEVWKEFRLPEILGMDPIELEKLIIKNFEKDKESIKRRLISNHIERREIIEELFQSYTKKHYHSVVILSYSIIDGISVERFGIQFWGYDNRLKNTRSEEIISKVEVDSVFKIIEKRLKNRGVLNQEVKNIPETEKKSSNNRHCVIHGESYLYGNKTNAIKSLLMLDFVSSLKIKS